MDKRHKELIIFGAVLVVLALMVAMTLGRGKGKSAAQRPKAAKTTVQVAQANTASAGEATAEAASSAKKDEGPLLPPQGNIALQPRHRDPFVPAINATLVADAQTGKTSLTTASSLTRVPPIPPIDRMFPTIFGPEVRPVGSAGGSFPMSPGPTAEPLVLTGIVADCPSVAIFRRGEKRFFVKPGDRFAGCKVIDISPLRVALVRGGKHQSVPLGGKL